MPAKKAAKKAAPSPKKKAVKKTAPAKAKNATAPKKKKKIEYPPITSIVAYPKVTVNYASECTQVWVNFYDWLNREYQMNLDPVRAFFIPKVDIEAMYNMFQQDSNINGCRVYLGMEPVNTEVIVHNEPPAGAMKLFMVGVLNGPSENSPQSGTDLLYSPTDGTSMVYDFTCPCPSTCDYISGLFHAEAHPLPPSATSKATKKAKRN